MLGMTRMACRLPLYLLSLKPSDPAAPAIRS
jgi:hypothetical protein